MYSYHISSRRSCPRASPFRALVSASDPMPRHFRRSNMAMPVDNKPGAFQADNGTAEVAASGRYAGRVTTLTVPQAKYDKDRATWAPVGPATLGKFSAVCWYTGKALLELSGDGGAPLGLIAAAVGGSPIEYWLPPSARVNVNKCESDVPQCDNMYNDSAFYTDQIEQIVP